MNKIVDLPFDHRLIEYPMLDRPARKDLKSAAARELPKTAWTPDLSADVDSLDMSENPDAAYKLACMRGFSAHGMHQVLNAAA